MRDGYVMLYRKMRRSPYYTDSQYVHLWVNLLLEVNHQKNRMKIKGTDTFIDINPGQLLTSRDALSKQTGINPSKIERILKSFESEQQIEQQTFSKYRIISITNWNTYQKVNSKADNKRTASEQQVNTNNNDKNEKKKTSGKIPAGEHHFFIAWWNMAFQKVTGHKPMINGRTGKQVQAMLASGISIKHLICYGAIVLTSEDDFYQKAGRTLAVLQGQLDSFKSKRNEYDIDYWRELGIMPPDGVALCDWKFTEAANAETEATI